MSSSSKKHNTNKMLKSYLKYRRRRKGSFRIHSPFVFDFVTKALKRAHNDDFEKLYSVYRVVDRHRFCTRHKRHKARLIYKTAAYFDPETIIVIGQMNAMNIAALALSCPQSQIYTTAWCEAYDELESMGMNNLRLIKTNDIKEILTDEEREAALIFLASPVSETTFLNDILPDDIVMVDNIHSDNDDEDGWESLKDREIVSFSMDLYHIGLLFFKQGFEKQEFIIKY